MSSIQSNSVYSGNIEQATNYSQVDVANSQVKQETKLQDNSLPPISKEKLIEYQTKAANLIKNAQRLSTAKIKLHEDNSFIKINKNDNQKVKELKSQVSAAYDQQKKAFTSLSKYKVSDFGSLLDKDASVKQLSEAKTKSKDKAYLSLKESLDSQLKCVNSLNDLKTKIGNNPSLDQIILQEEMRYAQLSSFVVAMHSKQVKMEGSVIDNLPFISNSARSSVQGIQDLVQKDLSELFKELDAIPKASYTKDNIRVIEAVSAKIDNIQAKLYSLNQASNLDGQLEGAENKPSLVINQDFINNLEVSLDAAKNRVLALKDPNSVLPAKSYLKDMFVNWETGKLTNLFSANAPIIKLFENMNKLHQAISEKMEGNKPLPSQEDIRAIIQEHNVHINPESSSSLFSAIKKIGKDDFTDEQKQLVQEAFGFTDLDNISAEQKDFIRELGVGLNSYIKSLKIEKKHELEEYERLTKCPSPEVQAEYIKVAFEHNLDLASIVEASVRGIPPELIETSPSPDMQVKAFGTGGMNTVYKCTSLDTDGTKKELIFKPELKSRTAFRYMNNYYLGYSASTKIIQLNLASQDVAELLGAKKSIVNTTAGCVNGSFGTFMELAPGQSPGSIRNDTILGETIKGEKINRTNIEKVLDPRTVLSIQRSLKQELCKLMWIDALSGQADRHLNNFFIQIDPVAGKVRITGIDNDSSFSKALIGPGTLDLTRLIPEVQTNFLEVKGKESEQNMQVNDPKLKKLNVQNLNEGQIHVFGLKSNLEKPSFIDRESYDNLMKIKPDEYKKLLEKRGLDEEHIESALLRLKNCQNHAKSLAKKNGVINFNNPEPSYNETLCFSTREREVLKKLGLEEYDV